MKSTTSLFAILFCLGTFCSSCHQADARVASAHDKNQKHAGKDKGKKPDKKNRSTKPGKTDAAPAVTVLKKWSMPSELREISGIARVDAERFACIQDEAGIIFIYNTTRQAIEQEINFAGPGDYEDIALVGTTAYVIRSDGQLYEVTGYRSGKPAVRTYATGFTAKQNIEGLFYDAAHRRLLLSVKGRDARSDAYKGIYAFDLASHRTQPMPVYRLSVTDPMLQTGADGKKPSQPMPSAIALHPQRDELYILDGPASRLLIMGPDGHLKATYQLGSDFPQAEGIAISPQGEVFISSEGVKGAGILAQVSLD